MTETIQSTEERSEKTEKTERTIRDDNVVLVGDKEIGAYVLALTKQKALGNMTVVLRARGKYISKAVDVEEVAKNNYMQNLKVKSVKFYTDVLQNKDKRDTRVSAIEIILEL